MVAKKKLKSNTSLNWKSVNLEGVIDGEDLQGFAGLEVLENYNSSLLKGESSKTRKRNFSISELDGDILSSSFTKKSKKCDNDDNESEEGDGIKEVRRRNKKISSNNSYPGKYVLLKPQEEDDNDFFADPEHSMFRSVLN